MKDVHWIDLGPWPPGCAVIADKRAYKRFVREKCREHSTLCPSFPGANEAHCQKMVSDSDCIFVIVVGEMADLVETAAALAHEATHMMRWLFEHIEEKEPGTEAQAYLVEHVVRQGLRALSYGKSEGMR